MTALPTGLNAFGRLAAALRGGGLKALRGLAGAEGGAAQALPVTLRPLRTLRALREMRPLERTATAGLAAGELGFAGFMGGLVETNVFRPLRRGGERQEAVIEAELTRRQRMLEEQIRLKGLQERMTGNLARLAAMAPDIYNQVAAGRRLPKDGVVIGGRPRLDLLEELALQMSTGGFQAPEPEQEYLDLMGAR